MLIHLSYSVTPLCQVSWDEDSARRLGVLPVPSPAFLFRAESEASSGPQAAAPPAPVQAAVLRAGSTLDIGVKLDGSVSVPVGRW